MKRALCHLIDVFEPLLAYHQLTMRCGVELRNATPRFMEASDLDSNAQFLQYRPGVCFDCAEIGTPKSKERFWTYGLSESQELLHEEGQ